MQCHPFAHAHYLFMHNGIIAGFSKIRRKLVEGLNDTAYEAVHSFHSDSAVSFALFLSFLPNMTDDLPAEALVHALQSVFETIAKVQAEAGIEQDVSLLNFVVTDGRTLIATRFVSSTLANPASLYYAEGTSFRCGSRAKQA
jgi:predicted glutamine amidotransferase